MLAANGGVGRGDKRKKGNGDTGGGNTGNSCSGEGGGADEGVMAVGGLRASDPNTLLNLYASLHDMSGVEIQKKINAYIQDATRANCSLIVQLWKDNKEAVVQVVGTTPIEQELRFPIVSNVLETVVSESKCVQAIVSELDQDLFELLNAQIGDAAVLAVPVEHPNGGVVIIVCLVFSEGQNHTLTDYCQAIVQECFRYCLGTVINTLAYEDEKRLHKQFQTLLLGASNLFSHVADVGDLMKEIVLEACKLTSAEKCSMFLLDDNGYLVSKIFNNQRCTEEVRLSVGQGIAGHVAETGKLVNIQDAYSHPLFYNAIDKKTGFRTRNILCFPILNKGKVIGVAELCNKKDGFDFDIFDEEVATAFSVYCGISIMHSLVYKKVQDAQARYQLSNELMMYHMKIENEDVESMVNCTEDHLIMWEDFYNFSFSTRLLPPASTAHIAFEMFSELGFMQHFNIKSECLARFILYVKKGYRSTPYHNWDHAMAVFHLACLFIKNLKLIENDHLTWVEGLALIVSAICHDIDHRGTTNQFQMASGTILASLYSSEGSVMERHHVSQTMCILNTEGCNIVGQLGSAEYRCFIDLISRLILATDLANHFRVVEQQEAMARDGYDRNNPKHREVFLYLLMTCCDLSDQIKSWEVCRHVTELVYKEFFSQGDLEKSMGTNPSEMMDRDRAKIPDLQIDFIKTVVLPAYRLLSMMFPEETSSCLATIEENLKRWEITEERFMQQWQQGCSPIDVLKEVCDDNIG